MTGYIYIVTNRFTCVITLEHYESLKLEKNLSFQILNAIPYIGSDVKWAK